VSIVGDDAGGITSRNGSEKAIVGMEVTSNALLGMGVRPGVGAKE
jgi:hypothetical protein